PSGNWTNLTRPPVTVREHHAGASCGAAGPGRQFNKLVNGPFIGVEGGPISASQSVEVEYAPIALTFCERRYAMAPSSALAFRAALSDQLLADSTSSHHGACEAFAPPATPTARA